MMLCMFIMSMISLMFPLFKHPLSMGILLIAQTVIVSLITEMTSKSFWFYLLFSWVLNLYSLFM